METASLKRKKKNIYVCSNESYPACTVHCKPDSAHLQEFILLVEGIIRKLRMKQASYDKLNVSGERSQAVQKLISSDVSGFISYGRRFSLIPESEIGSLFDGLPIGPKPDGLFRIKKQGQKSTRGVMVEVERGQSIQNNADLKDIWKCHICKHTEYLILFVPIELCQARKRERVYARVVNRLAPFFSEGMTINVEAVAIIGY